MTTTNGDLDLTESKGDTQTTGLRFLLDVPSGATIVNAYIQFTADEIRSSATSLTIKGQNSGNASTFTSTNGDISARATTESLVNWSSVPSWTILVMRDLPSERPILRSIIQEIIDDSSWSSGNGLAIIIKGTGKRPAETYDADPTKAAVLHVEYSNEPSENQIPTAVVDSVTTVEDAAVVGNVLDGSLSVVRQTVIRMAVQSRLLVIPHQATEHWLKEWQRMVFSLTHRTRVIPDLIHLNIRYRMVRAERQQQQ